MIHGKVLSIYNKNTKTGPNSQHVCAQFNLGGGSTTIADVNIRSIQVVPAEESNTVEEQSVVVAEEQVPPNPTVDDGGTNAIAVAEDDATTSVAMDVSSTDDTILNTAKSLSDDMNVLSDDSNEGHNAVRGDDTKERVPNTTETSEITMLEDNPKKNPPAETSVSNGNLPTKKWGIVLHSGDALYWNSDIHHMYSPLDHFFMSFPNDQIELRLKETNKQSQEHQKKRD